jgi:protein O-mannosyl-transferase
VAVSLPACRAGGSSRALWAVRTRTRAPLAAALLFGGILFPVLGFFNIYPFRFSFVADHFAYLASIPVLALVAAGLAEGAARWRWPPRARAGAAAIVLAGLGVITFQQSGQYADAETLYRETLRRNPSSWMAHGNLGMLLLEREPATALTHLDEAIRLHPGVAESRLNRGNALQRLGRTKEAIAEYQAALAIDPRMAKAHNNLSSGLLALGDAAGAMTHAQEALRLQPDLVEAHYNAGRGARLLGRFGDASHI